jgi:hypothetical protein
MDACGKAQSVRSDRRTGSWIMPWHKSLLRFFCRKPVATSAKFTIEKRRGERVPAAMSVFVYGRVSGVPFAEQTETDNISAQGGLLALSTGIQRSQTLLLTNLQTNEDLACRVARLAITDKGKTLVGVEFLRPAPRFWSIEFRSAGLNSGSLR